MAKEESFAEVNSSWPVERHAASSSTFVYFHYTCVIDLLLHPGLKASRKLRS